MSTCLKGSQHILTVQNDGLYRNNGSLRGSSDQTLEFSRAWPHGSKQFFTVILAVPSLDPQLHTNDCFYVFSLLKFNFFVILFVGWVCEWGAGRWWRGAGDGGRCRFWFIPCTENKVEVLYRSVVFVIIVTTIAITVWYDHKRDCHPAHNQHKVTCMPSMDATWMVSRTYTYLQEWHRRFSHRCSWHHSCCILEWHLHFLFWWWACWQSWVWW